MKRAVVFVEGQTEQIFVCELVRQLRPGVALDVLRERKGLQTRLWGRTHKFTDFEIVVIDCGSGERVLSSMLENRARQAEAGFVLQLGLQDVFPAELGVIPKLRARLARGTDGRMRSALFFAVMEIETWFLGSLEHVGGSGWEPPMSVERARRVIESHLQGGSLEDLPRPGKVIEDIYAQQGHRYLKSVEAVKRIVNAIDWDDLYVSSATRLPHLHEIIVELEQFLIGPESKHV